MKREEAELLKEKYYAATASPEEERRLAAFLRSEECPEEWADERRALLALLSLEADGLPEGFGMRLTKRLEQERKKSRRARIWRFARISAAAILLLVPLSRAVRLALQQPAEQVEVMAKSEKKAQTEPAAASPSHQDTPDMEQGKAKARQDESESELERPKTPQDNSSKNVERRPSLPPKKQKPRHRTAQPAAPPAPTAAEKLLATQSPASQGTTATSQGSNAAAQSTNMVAQNPNTAPQAEKSASDALPQTKSALESQLERTLRSRDRLMAEARAYMAGNCLDRRMPPLQTTDTEP